MFETLAYMFFFKHKITLQKHVFFFFRDCHKGKKKGIKFLWDTGILMD